MNKIITMFILFMLAFVTSLKADSVHGYVIYNYMSYCTVPGDSAIRVGITSSPDWFRVLHPPTPGAFGALRGFCNAIEWCQVHGKRVTITYQYGDVGQHICWYITGVQPEDGGPPPGWKGPSVQPSPEHPVWE